MNLLTSIKNYYGIDLTDNDKDSRIQMIIGMCKSDAVSYCNFSEYSDVLDYNVIQMSIEKYNKFGNEGVKSVSQSGVSESYNDDYSPAIYTSLKKFKKARFI